MMSLRSQPKFSDLAHPGVDGAVAHGDEEVLLLELNAGFVDHLAVNLRAGCGNTPQYFPSRRRMSMGVVILDDLRLFGLSMMWMMVKVE